MNTIKISRICQIWVRCKNQIHLFIVVFASFNTVQLVWAPHPEHFVHLAASCSCCFLRLRPCKAGTCNYCVSSQSDALCYYCRLIRHSEALLNLVNQVLWPRAIKTDDVTAPQKWSQKTSTSPPGVWLQYRSKTSPTSCWRMGCFDLKKSKYREK